MWWCRVLACTIAIGIAAALAACGAKAPTAPAGCAYVVAPSTQSVPIGGGTYTATVTTSAPSCGWTAAADASWINITAGTAGTTTGTVSYAVPASADILRTGNILIRWSTGNAAVAVSQDGVTQCVYTLTPGSQSAPASGGTFSFTATRNTPNGCAFTATTSTSWLLITGGSTGQSGDKVTYAVASNTGGARAGAIDVTWSGGAATFSVTQVAAPGAARVR